jgi:hypothetical protein
MPRSAAAATQVESGTERSGGGVEGSTLEVGPYDVMRWLARYAFHQAIVTDLSSC